MNAKTIEEVEVLVERAPVPTTGFPWPGLVFLACVAGMATQVAHTPVQAAPEEGTAPGAPASRPSPALEDVGSSPGVEALSVPSLPPGGGLQVQTYELRNGLTVVVAPIPGLPMFSATMHYRVGSAREWQGLFGVTELIAQLLLDGAPGLGTRDSRLEARLLRKLDRLDARIRALAAADGSSDAAEAPSDQEAYDRLVAERDRLVAELDRISSRDVFGQLYRDRGATEPVVSVTPTEVQVRVSLPANQLSYFFALEAARLSGFSSRHFYMEREALAGRRAEDFSDPGFLLVQGLVADAFHVHPFGRYRADPDSILGIGRAELEYYRRQYFKPSQVVLSVAGGVRPRDVWKLAERYLAGLPSPGGRARRLEPVEPLQQGERRLWVGGGDHQEVLFAFHLDAAGVRWGNPVLPVLIALLQDQQRGPLRSLYPGAERPGVIERLVVTEYPSSPPLGAEYPSLLVVGARGVEGTESAELEWLLFDRLQAIGQSGPGKEAMEAARLTARERIAAAMAQPSTLAAMLARACATAGDPEALFEMFDAIQNVTEDQVREVASQLFVRSNMTVGLLTTGQAPPERRPGADGEAHEAGKEVAP